jgi:hypothetical protein
MNPALKSIRGLVVLWLGILIVYAAAARAQPQPARIAAMPQTQPSGGGRMGGACSRCSLVLSQPARVEFRRAALR